MWCNVGASGKHCIESPNRACLEPGADCRVLLKSSDTYDRHLVEDMIANASLPLVIVYTGGDMRRAPRAPTAIPESRGRGRGVVPPCALHMRRRGAHKCAQASAR